MVKGQEKYFGPAVIVGQLTGVQNSVRVPNKRFTWLKKSTAVEKEGKVAKNHFAVNTYICAHTHKHKYL